MNAVRSLLVVVLLCGACACSDEPPAAKPEPEWHPKQQAFAAGRIENQISIETTGCLTIDEFDRTATAPASAVPGCIDLDRGTRVIGPLEVKVIKSGDRDFKYARIEVPGNGERWTFLAHLAKDQ